ncbi:MAG: 50S ribosomal protein L11 methyltransferase [Thermodesulfobacteriota bacterium]
MKTVDLKSEGLFKLSQIKIEVSQAAAGLVSDYLLGLGSLGVAEDIQKNGTYQVSAYFPMEIDIADVVSNLEQYSKVLKDSLPDVQIGSFTAEHIDQSSWQVWKSVLKKIRAGNRVIIRPPWEDHNPSEGEIVVEINPSLAFGTGHHETTRLCVGAIEEIVSQREVQNALDIGCGSAILSICAYKFGIEDVVGFDTDPIAISESRKNARKNNVEDKIKFFCGYLSSVKGEYDLIVANVYIEPILAMKEDLKSRLAQQGTLVISGIPHTRRDEAVRGLHKAGLKLTKEHREGDWVALEFAHN